MERRANGEGTYEKLPKGKVRLVKWVGGTRIPGPSSDNRKDARDAWKAKFKAIQKTREQPEEEESTTVGAEVYFRLYGVYQSDSPPKTVGPWKHELAGTTYDLYKRTFKNHIRTDPIAFMDPAAVERQHLEAYRSRLSAKVGPRSVLRYMTPVIKVLTLHGNRVADELDSLKLPRIVKGLLKRPDRDAYLKLMVRPQIELAVRIMLHGVTVSETCGLLGHHFDGTHLTIEEQYNEIGGKGERTNDLKRPRRYRRVPCSPELRKLLKGIPPDRPIIQARPDKPYLRSSLSRAIARALEGTRFAGISPHDLRSSGGKWMLDRKAKLSDVAAILGNDARTLLLHYDQADEIGMERAVRMAL